MCLYKDGADIQVDGDDKTVKIFFNDTHSCVNFDGGRKGKETMK